MPKKVILISSISAIAMLFAIPVVTSANDRHDWKGDQLAQTPAKAKAEKAKKPKRLTRSARRFMNLYDLNGDGKVTTKEISTDQSKILGAMDIDNDKGLSVDEMRRRGRSLQIWRSVTLFDLLDANGDQKVTAEELSAPMKRWFKRYDENGDGVMEASEVPDKRRGKRGKRRGRR